LDPISILFSPSHDAPTENTESNFQ